MPVEIVHGNLFDQQADALVNAWNGNVLPRWWPSFGVSGQLKARTGRQPWRELKSFGYLRPGAAVVTGAGDLPVARVLIDVVGLHLWWRASPDAVCCGIGEAATLADRIGLRSVATPLVGAGTGGLNPRECRRLLVDTLSAHPSVASGRVRWSVVVFAPPT